MLESPVDNDLEFKLRPDLAITDISSPAPESLFIEIRQPLSKNIIIGVIYRPPDSNVNNFVPNFNSLLAKIGKENTLSYSLGDFNLNLMNYHSNSLSIGNSTVSTGIWDKYREGYFKIHQNITSRGGGE